MVFPAPDTHPVQPAEVALQCPNCCHEFHGSIENDDLGWHTSCPACGQSFDVDDLVPFSRVADTVLEDDDTETGGIAFAGETVRDFFDDIGTCGAVEDDFVHMDKLNELLVFCGIQPIMLVL